MRFAAVFWFVLLLVSSPAYAQNPDSQAGGPEPQRVQSPDEGPPEAQPDAGRGRRGGGRRGQGRRGGGGGAPQPPAVVVPAGAQVVHLWPNGAPGSEDRKDEEEQIRGEQVLNVHNPSITVMLPPPEKRTGVGLILAPGGGHSSLYIMHEGFHAAEVLVDRGLAVFVLKNRLQSSGYRFDVEGLADMQRAVRLIRSRAEEWGVQPNKIGAGGFSAGGELAELVADRNDAGNPEAADPVERVNSRPDFQVLIYPGKSHLIQPTAASPPAFMAAGNNDRPDISVGLAEAYLRFKAVGVPAELHMYAFTGHGFGIRPERAGMSHQEWTTQLMSFLRQGGFLTSPQQPANPD